MCHPNTVHQIEARPLHMIVVMAKWRHVLKWMVIFVLCFMFVGACRNSHFMNSSDIKKEDEAYNACLQAGLKNIEIVKEFHEIYPTTFDYISYFSGTNAPQVWNSEVGLYQHYILMLQLNVKIDRSTLTIETLGQPVFFLDEITNVTENSGGSYKIQNGQSHSFSQAEWSKIYRVHGNLSVIGINLETNRPVTDFDKALTNR